MRKVIFLDIDGVLQPIGSRGRFKNDLSQMQIDDNEDKLMIVL